ncbi:MAG TPA: hypothetical protein DCX95_04175 [Elusimicrobia bacterium]|nr:hypothetical protein [Elusimicrobiota bacterium]
MKKTIAKHLPEILDLSNKNFNFFCIFLIFSFNFLLRFPFLNIPLERDEGEYAYISQIIGEKGIPYKDAFNQKPPGVFYLYRLVFSIFGEKILALRLFVVFYNFISIFLIYQIGKILKSADFGIISALIYAIVSSERRLLGFSANTEIFMLAPIIGSMYFILIYQIFYISTFVWFSVRDSGSFQATCFFKLYRYFGIYFICWNTE